MRLGLFALACSFLAGCSGTPAGPAPGGRAEPADGYRFTRYKPAEQPAPPPPPAVPDGTLAVITGTPLAADQRAVVPPAPVPPARPVPQDAVIIPDLVYSIEVFELMLPQDTVSRNDELWKRIDETSVDVATYDVLYKNGIRVGIAPLAELEGLQKLTEERKNKSYTLTGAAGKQIELEMNTGVPQQTLFYFDARNNLIGRHYEKSDNLMIMSFESTPRKPGWVRLAMMPTIRSTERKLIYALLPGRPDRDVSYLVSETPINVNLHVDMPVNRFMVIAPAPADASFPRLLGRAFLTKDSPAEKLERVLVVVPQAFKRENVTAENKTQK